MVAASGYFDGWPRPGESVVLLAAMISAGSA
jgi:hypothetical protein